MLINCLLSWLKYSCNCLGDFPAYRRRQASLVEEVQDGVLHHNTWCSGTNYGGINPYTLMGRYGPHHQRWLGPQDKDVRRMTLVGVHRMATRYYTK